jgi:hypothetical protein
MDGTILYANEPMCDAIGRGAEFVKNTSFLHHFAFGASPSEDLDHYTDLFLKNSKTGKSTEHLTLRTGNASYNAECSVLELDCTAYLLVQLEPR